ncbi:MAG: hypothetical protein AAF705_20050, partial [Bacteroidota bacterium]
AASNPNPASEIIETQNEKGIWVVMEAELVKKTSRGAVIKITGFNTGKSGVPLKKNQFSGIMVKAGDKIGIDFNTKGRRIAQVMMPEDMKVPPPLAKKLGATQSVVMSGGSTMLQPQSKNMLWFEIQ